MGPYPAPKRRAQAGTIGNGPARTASLEAGAAHHGNAAAAAPALGPSLPAAAPPLVAPARTPPLLTATA